MPRFLSLRPTQIKTLVIGSAGVLGAMVLNIPLPWLLGPIASCLLAALLRQELQATPLIGKTMRTVLGVAVGVSVTPELFARFGTMAVSLALMPIFIIAIGAVGYPFFRRIAGYDPATSFYAAMPGGLQDMLVFGEEAGGNARTLSLIHATRVLVVVFALPFLLVGFLDTPLTNPPGAPAVAIPLDQYLLMIFCAVFGWWLAQRVGMFGAPILGPLIAAAIASMFGLLITRPPAEAILAAQFFIGLGVGAKYVGITVRELRHDILAAFGYCTILGGLSGIFVMLCLSIGLAGQIETILAFSPGGQAEMAVLALVAGADVAFVVTHHLVRIFVVILGAPVFFRFFK